MEQTNATSGRNAPFNFEHFVLNRYNDKESEVSENEVKSAFIIADNYLKDFPKPYENQNDRYHTNNYTPIFLMEGGFQALWEEYNTPVKTDSPYQTNINNLQGNLIQGSDFRNSENNQSVTNTPALKEKQHNAIVTFILKFWWAVLLPLIIGVTLLAIEYNWFA